MKSQFEQTTNDLSRDQKDQKVNESFTKKTQKKKLNGKSRRQIKLRE